MFLFAEHVTRGFPYGPLSNGRNLNLNIYKKLLAILVGKKGREMACRRRSHVGFKCGSKIVEFRFPSCLK